MEYQKVKSAGKQVIARGPKLDSVILSTLKKISDVVGATLGPHGQPVLIERYEYGLPPLVTKDGVTVFRALGFMGAMEHCVMEATRDAASRTAADAGDGTTTATILAAALVSKIQDYCNKNRRESPQKVVRRLEATFRNHIEPLISKLSVKAEFDDSPDPTQDEMADLAQTNEQEYISVTHALVNKNKFLRSVATVSSNGDTELADAVMKCFSITGDEGNVTLTEASGSGPPRVEHLKGFAIGVGYDESCAKFAAAFINDAGTQRTVMSKPVFLLYHGHVSEIQTVKLLMELVAYAWQNQHFNHNVVIVATGFSESVLANLAGNFQFDGSINVFPLVIPHSPQSNGQLNFLQDLQAITGATILDPLTRPAESATLADLGPGVESFECSRFRSTILGYADPDLVAMRVEELNNQLQSPESQLDEILTRERKAKLTGGIAKLIIVGSSNGELKERKDRAEDAVCAVRGAIKHGCLPGGAWTLLKIINSLPQDRINGEILVPALMAPFERLISNSGIVDEQETRDILMPILDGINRGVPIIYDFLNQKHANAFDSGVLDSTPAVREAIRNSISIAAQMGTLGGIIVQNRDQELERAEARSAASFERDSNINEANERA